MDQVWPARGPGLCENTRSTFSRIWRYALLCACALSTGGRKSSFLHLAADGLNPPEGDMKFKPALCVVMAVSLAGANLVFAQGRGEHGDRGDRRGEQRDVDR